MMVSTKSFDYFVKLKGVVLHAHVQLGEQIVSIVLSVLFMDDW